MIIFTPYSYNTLLVLWKKLISWAYRNPKIWSELLFGWSNIKTIS